MEYSINTQYVKLFNFGGKTMKRLISIFLIVFTILSLGSCSKKSSKKSAKDDDEIIFSDFVGIDNKECKISITSFEVDKDVCTLKVELENKSSDKEYIFTLSGSTINGVKCDSYLYTNVSAGKKAKEEIEISTGKLKENGINNFTDIAITFRVYDDENLMADDTVNETVHVYPYGEDKAENYVRASLDTDKVLLDNEYATITLIGKEKTKYGYSIELYVLNKSDSELVFTASNASINDYMVSASFYESLLSQTAAFAEMTWSKDTLEENDISNVERIDFELTMYKPTDLYFSITEKITIIP